MKVGVYVNRHGERDIERKIYFDILKHNGIDCALLGKTELKNVDSWGDYSHMVYKWGHTHDDHLVAKSLIPLLDSRADLKLFPNLATCWHYDDKIKQDLQMKLAKFPFVDSWLFYEKDEALLWSASVEYPIVFKLANGSGSHNVFLIKSKKEAQRSIREMFGKGRPQDKLSFVERYKLLNGDIHKIYKYYRNKHFNFLRGLDSSQYWMVHKNYAYYQKFCAGNEYDIRVSTAGLRAHAFKRFVRKGDFRASGSRTWDINPDRIDMRCIRIALDVSKFFGFQAMAYDFVYDGDNPVIVEMSYAYGGAGYPDFMNGYWDSELNWHQGRFYPQHFELIDLLEDPDLKCPNIDLKTSYDGVTIIP